MKSLTSVFSDDPQNPQPGPDTEEPDPNPPAWSFGGLIKTLATRSESAIKTYRRDLGEFGSALNLETTTIPQAAARAVKDLPASLELGASLAQYSLESLGQSIDDLGSSVIKGTAQIIEHGREVISALDHEDDNKNNGNDNDSDVDGNNGQTRYTRFDAQLYAIRIDDRTYCEEPEDSSEYGEWKLGFVVDKKADEIESLIGEDGVMRGVYSKLVVSGVIDRESFWRRYFYRVYKLRQAEDARVKLVKKAILGEEEEDLTWDFDEDEDKDNFESEENNLASGNEKIAVTESIKKENKFEDNKILVEKLDLSVVNAVDNSENDNGGSCKDSDISIVSTQPSLPEEEDIGWDEIEEDIGSSDQNKVVSVDLRKRLIAAEDDEDLTWDIEDEDELITIRR